MAGTSHNRLFYNFILILALLATVFVSMLGRNTLVSVALEQEARCGQVEHTHTPECYWNDILACTQKAHMHNENCYLLRLEDNDVNWLLHLIDGTSDHALESVIDSAIVQAIIMAPEIQHGDYQQVVLMSEEIRQLNQIIKDNNIMPAVVLNENLNDTTLVYTPPEVLPEETTEPLTTETTVETTAVSIETSELPTILATTVPTAATTPTYTTPAETTVPTEPTETTVPTEPTETTVPTEPTETTVPTEPTETTVPTEPTETTVPTEPTETTVPTEPTETTVPTEPTETKVPTEPTETTVPTEPTETTVPTEPTETTVPTEPTETTVPTEPTETTVPTEPTETTVPTEPTETTVPTEPTETTVPTEPTETTVPTEPTETTVPTEPTETTVPTESTETTASTEPTQATTPAEQKAPTDVTVPPLMLAAPRADQAATFAVGGKPSAAALAINFYIRIDGVNTFVNSATLTKNTDWLTQTGKEYCAYDTLYQAITNGTNVITNMTTANVGTNYFVRYNTNGGNNFNSNPTFSNNHIYFSDRDNGTQYALLTSSRTQNKPIDFYTVTLDYSAVGLDDQVQYVEKNLNSTFTLSENYRWYTDAAGTKLATAANLQNITKAVTLYARYGSHTISFQTNDGSAVADMTVSHGALATPPAEPTKENFLFAGWFTDSALTKPYDFTQPVEADLTLYAKWAPARTIRFVDAEGNQLIEPRKAKDGDTLNLPEGYTWVDAGGNRYDGGKPVTVAGDATYTGTIQTFTVTFMNGETVYKVIEDVPYNTTVLLPEQPVRENSRFRSWYQDEAFTQDFDAFTRVKKDLTVYARWQYDVTLVYLDENGNTANSNTFVLADGESVTLPDHYTWVDSGPDPEDPADDKTYQGNTEFSPVAHVTLTGTPETYTVSFLKQDGISVYDPIKVIHGNGFLIPDAPEGFVWVAPDGTNYIGGDYFDTVTEDMNLVTQEVSITIKYNVSFPTGSGHNVDKVPTLYGTTSATATDTVAGGKSAQIRSLTSNTARREVNADNKESLTYYFKGWKVEGTNMVIAADSMLTWNVLAEYAGSDKSVNLVGQWETGARLNSVTFYVRFDSVATDTEGNIGSRPTTDYTPEVFNTYLGGLPSQDANALKQFEIADTTADNSYTADQEIRALYGERSSGIWMYEFPSDEQMFSHLKTYLQNNPSKSLSVDGIKVNANELDAKHYAIRWYVFKLEGSSWHVDGKLVRRQGLIDIYKDFKGEEPAIVQAEKGFYIVARNGIKEADGSFTPYDSNSSKFKQYVLVLDQATENALKSTYPNATFSYTEVEDRDNHSYEWLLDNILLDEYWEVTEYPKGEISGYSQYAEYSVYDSDGELTAVAEYGTLAKVVGKTFALDEDPEQGLTVHYTNYYYPDHSILLKKEDAATGAGIGGAGFQFIQKDNILGFTPNADGSYTQNVAEPNTNVITGGNGYVAIDGFSYQYGADSNTGERGKILIRETIVPTGYGWAGTVELGLDSNDNVYISQITTIDGNIVPAEQWHQYAELPRNDILIIKNHVTDLISVTANKVWNTNVPQDRVDVVLQANGQNAANVFPGLQNAQVVLNADNGWTHTWEDLPRYASGQPVSWGIKEVAVGNAPTLSDGVSFANWIPVYSAGIGSDTDGDGVTDNWAFTVTNYSKSPKLIVTKIGLEDEGLAGATFTLEPVELKNGQWQKLSGATTLTQTTDSNGMLTFENLVGTYTYRLTELRPPTGYIILIEPVLITVDGDGNITQLDSAGNPIPFGNDFLRNPSPYNIVVRNLIAVELPETGGMGRQVYMWLGLALMLSTLLLYKRSFRREGRNTS